MSNINHVNCEIERLTVLRDEVSWIASKLANLPRYENAGIGERLEINSAITRLVHLQITIEDMINDASDSLVL